MAHPNGRLVHKMIKRFCAILLFCLVSSGAFAQCGGVFSAGSVCGSVSGGPPKAVPFTSFIGGSAGVANTIQTSNGSSGFSDSGWLISTPVNGTAVTGKMMVPSSINCSGCSGTDVVALTPNSSYTPGGHGTFFGSFTTVNSPGGVGIGSEGAILNALHCFGGGNAFDCESEGSITIGHGAIAGTGTDRSVVIGNSASVTNGQGVAIGNGVTITSGNNSVLIGGGTIGSGFSTAVGNNVSIPASCGGCIAIGNGATPVAAGEAVFGAVGGGVATVHAYLGSVTTPVYGHMGGIMLAAPITKTTDYTVGDYDYDIIFNCSGSCTLTLPGAGNENGTNRIIRVKTIANQTVAAASSVVIPLVGGSAGTAILAGTAGKWAELHCDGTNWIIMAGN